jgi:transposase
VRRLAVKDCTRRTPVVTIGLDIGDTYCHIYALDRAGEFLEEGRVRNNPEDLRTRFAIFPRGRVALETGTHSPWLSQLLLEQRHEVVVANARQLHLISQSQKKCDRLDAELLARLAYSDPKLLSPIQHRGPDAQADLAVLRSRDALVAARTMLVNHVRGVVKSAGGRLPSCSTEAFPATVQDSIPEDRRPALAPLLKTIKELSKGIRRYDQQIEKQCEKKYPETRRLRQVRGVGLLTSLVFILVLEDPRRFKDSRKVGAFLGLTPRRDESGDQKPQLRITKAGDGFLRRLLIGSAQYILGPFGTDTDLRRFGEAIAQRGGKNGKKRAVTAVARKLAVLLHRLWISGEAYEPLRNTKRRERGAAAAGPEAPALARTGA